MMEASTCFATIDLCCVDLLGLSETTWETSSSMPCNERDACRRRCCVAPANSHVPSPILPLPLPPPPSHQTPPDLLRPPLLPHFLIHIPSPVSNSLMSPLLSCLVPLSTPHFSRTPSQNVSCSFPFRPTNISYFYYGVSSFPYWPVHSFRWSFPAFPFLCVIPFSPASVSLGTDRTLRGLFRRNSPEWKAFLASPFMFLGSDVFS